MADTEPVSSTPLTRLRSRIMAASYKYQMLGGARNTAEDDDPASARERAQQSSRCHLQVALIITCLLLFILSALLIWQHLYYQSSKQCLTADCVEASAYIAAKMDASVEPCQDFYHYACGGWQKTTLIPPDKSHYGAFTQVADKADAVIKKLLDPGTPLSDFGQKSKAVQKARTFYNNCMDLTTINKLGIAPALKLIKELGSWSVTNDSVSGSWNPATWTLQSAVEKSHALGHSPLFGIAVVQDDKNSSINILRFMQSGLTLSDREEYFNNRSENYKKGMLAFASQTGKLLKGDNQVATKMAEVYEFEKSLAKIMVPKENLTDPVKTYHKMSVADLQKILGSQLDLNAYLASMFGRDLPPSTPLLCSVPQYFKQLGQLLANTSKQVLADYVVWNTLQAIPGYLPQTFVDAAMELSRVETGVETVSPRWQRCVSKTLANVGFAVSSLFVQETFSPESRTQVERILGEIKTAFIHNLATVSWMDDTTRARAADKAASMATMIGYPDWITHAARLDAYYAKLTIVEGTFLDNHLDSARFDVQRILAHLGRAPDRNEWHMMPAEVNAYYDSVNNQVVFPAAILQRPFFAPTFPLAFKYGAFGMVSGHELTHGFDNTGRKFDKFGNMHDWWTNASVAGFERSKECMVQQYSHYKVEGLPLHGRYTLGENIADNGGLKMAYKALDAKLQRRSTNFLPLPALDLDEKQLFFVGFAQSWCSYYTPQYARQSVLIDEHSYPKYRVIGTLSNMKAFADTFNCPANSPMNPDKKCVVW